MIVAAVLCVGCDDSSSRPQAADRTPASPALAETTPKVVADCIHPRREPHRMLLACARAGFRAEQLRWPVWGPRRAQGSGVFRVRFRSMPGNITLGRPRRCAETGDEVFTRGRVQLRAAVGGTKVYDIARGCPPGAG